MRWFGMKWMAGGVHLGSFGHYRHAHAVFPALSVPRTTAVGSDDIERVRVTRWRGFAQRHAWRGCHGLSIEGAPYPDAIAAHETDPDPDAYLPGASHAAPDLLANPHAGSHRRANANT